MPVFIVVLGILACALGAVIMLTEREEGWAFRWCLGGLVLVGWFVIAGCQTKTYDKIEEYPVQVISNISTITYFDNHKPVIVNLNDKLQRQFNEGDIIQVKYPHQWSGGIYWILDVEYEAKQ